MDTLDWFFALIGVLFVVALPNEWGFFRKVAVTILGGLPLGLAIVLMAQAVLEIV